MSEKSNVVDNATIFAVPGRQFALLSEDQANLVRREIEQKKLEKASHISGEKTAKPSFLGKPEK